MRPSTSVSQACGSMPLSLAVSIRVKHRCGALAAAIGAGEQPRLAADSYSAQCPLGGIVGQADAAVVQEAGEGRPALQHVVDCLGDLGMAREPGPFAAHPALQLGADRLDALLPH